MPQQFTIGESCILLNVDRVTLKRWLDIENMTPHIDPRDKRVKYLTREDLDRLAAQHNRSVRDELQALGLTGAQREMQAQLQQLMAEVRDLRARQGIAGNDDDPDTTVRLRPGEWETLDPIPSGWIAPDDMAKQLGVPLRTFKHALRPRYDGDPEQHGTIGWHAGRWRRAHPGNYATQALDLDQQVIARARFAKSNH